MIYVTSISFKVGVAGGLMLIIVVKRGVALFLYKNMA